MDLLNYNVNLKEFETLKDFNKEFKVNKEDVVLTTSFLVEKLKKEFDANILEVEDYCKGEPDDIGTDMLIDDIRKLNAKRIIAIGGGSVLDLAKICSVAKEEHIDDLFNKLPKLNKTMELITIPTTCGTGSEVTNIAVVNRTKIGTKMGLASSDMFADYACLIPELIDGLPLKVFATSSIDALVHAMESVLSPKATEYSELFSYEAIRVIIESYKYIVANGLDSRFKLNREFLIAANYAGIAFGSAGTGCVHAMAYPLGGVCHVAHGESNYTILTAVMYYYAKHSNSVKLDKLMNCLANLLECSKDECFVKLEDLLNNVLPKKTLKEYGAKFEDLPNWANSCYKNQQRLLKNSLIEMSEEAILEIYNSIY